MQGRDEVDLIEYLNALWKWKWLVAGGTILTVTVAFVVASQTPLTYEASVTLRSAPSRISGMLYGPAPEAPTPDTFVSILKDRSLAVEAMRHLGLDKPPHKVTVDQFVSRIISVKPLKRTGLIILTVTLPDPQLAADTANFVAHKAVEVLARLNQGDAPATGDFFRQQRNDARKTLDHAWAALKDFRRKTDLESLEIEQTITVQETTRLAILAAELSTKQVGLLTRRKELSRALVQQEPTLTLNKSIVTDPALIAAASDYGRTDVKALSALQLKSQEINPTYQEIRQELIDAEASFASLENERKDVERKLEEIKRKLGDIRRRTASAKPKLEELTHGYMQAQDAYQFWNRKGDEAVVSLVAHTTDLQIISAAIAPTRPTSRKVTQTATFAGAVALITCTLLAFFVEYFLKVRQQRGGIR